jgi:predicted dinucleotide-utilizing enzyme
VLSVDAVSDEKAIKRLSRSQLEPLPEAVLSVDAVSDKKAIKRLYQSQRRKAKKRLSRSQLEPLPEAVLSVDAVSDEKAIERLSRSQLEPLPEAVLSVDAVSDKKAIKRLSGSQRRKAKIVRLRSQLEPLPEPLLSVDAVSDKKAIKRVSRSQLEPLPHKELSAYAVSDRKASKHVSSTTVVKAPKARVEYENEGDGYVVYRIESSGETRRPFERILQAAATTLDAPTNMDPLFPNMPTSFSREDELAAAIAGARSWVEAHKIEVDVPLSQRRVELPRTQPPDMLLAAKTILARLARAHQSFPLPFHACDDGDDIEGHAGRILDTLWKMDGQQPDGDAYSFYLLCLCGHNPTSIAEKANEILRRMQDGRRFHGHVLPPPSTLAFNAVIQLWAQVGGTSGRYVPPT